MYWIEAKQIAAAPLGEVGGKALLLARHIGRGMCVPDMVLIPPGACIDSVESLVERLGPGPWMVRSSAPDEDRPDGSAAGRYRSEAVERGDREGLEAAIGRVRSCGGPDRELPVLVQLLVIERFAGVLFTRHPMRPSEAVLEAARGRGDSITGGGGVDERWSWDRSRGGWRGRGRRISRERPLFANPGDAAEVLALGIEIESLEGGARDIEWAWGDRGPILLQDRPVASAPAPSAYFLPERFPTGVSCLGWSLLGPAIRRRAIEDPLRFVGRRLCGPAIVLRRGVPHLTLEAETELFRYFPATILPDEVLRGNAVLRRAWWRRVVNALPGVASLCGTLLREPDWCPPAHKRRWFDFVAELHAALQAPPLDREWIAAAAADQALCALDATVAWTDRLLTLHRWSLVHAELIWRLTGKRPLEDPRHATARVRSDLEELKSKMDRGGMKPDLAEFLARHGHRAASIDPAQPTWSEEPQRVEKLLALKSAQPSPNGSSRALVQKCRGSISALGPIAKWRRFALELREDQRNEWHRILARMRAAALRAGELLVEEGRLESVEDVFRMQMRDLRDTLRGRDVNIELGPIWPRHVESPADTRGTPALLRGLGVSVGRARGIVHRVHRMEDLTEIPAGCILVARAVDPAWTPAFRAAGALVQELGGLLSHAAILARESGLPAVMSVEHATSSLREGELVEVDGGAGTVARLRS